MIPWRPILTWLVAVPLSAGVALATTRLAVRAGLATATAPADLEGWWGRKDTPDTPARGRGVSAGAVFVAAWALTFTGTVLVAGVLLGS